MTEGQAEQMNRNGPKFDVENPWRNEDLLRFLYDEMQLTHEQIGDVLGCSQGTITDWCTKHGIEPRSPTAQRVGGPWTDRELMYELYVEEKKSTEDIAAEFECSSATVNEWLERHSIDKRSRSEAQMIVHGTENKYNLSVDSKGYEVWYVGSSHIWVHRLLAVAEWGLDAISGKVVHHKNGIPWDNRPDNLELMDHAEHSAHHHQKLDYLDKIKIAEMYKSTDASWRDLASVFDVNATTIGNAIREVEASAEC